MVGFPKPISGSSHSLISLEAPSQLIHHRSPAGEWSSVHSAVHSDDPPCGHGSFHTELLSKGLLLPGSKLQSKITAVIFDYAAGIQLCVLIPADLQLMQVAESRVEVLLKELSCFS